MYSYLYILFLLQTLASAEGNILENKVLLESLNKTKASSMTIAESLQDAHRIQTTLDQVRGLQQLQGKICTEQNDNILSYLLPTKFSHLCFWLEKFLHYFTGLLLIANLRLFRQVIQFLMPCQFFPCIMACDKLF